MPQDNALAIASTNTVTLSELRDAETGAYLEDATVVVSLLDAAGVAVASAQDLTMTKVTGTSGPSTKYKGTIPSTVVLTEQTYVVRVTATDATGVLRIDEDVPAD